MDGGVKLVGQTFLLLGMFALNGMTVQRESYPLWLRMVSSALRAVDQCGGNFGNLDPDNVIARAQRMTGLTDVGDPSFRVPMEKFLSTANDSDMTGLARVFIRQTALRAVRNRLFIEQYLAANPQVKDQPIKRPIFILGFPRTGTTLLQNLMHLEPGRRALRFWELTSPVPVSDDPDKDKQKRLRTAERTLKLAYLVAPEMGEVHEVRPSSLEECWPLFTATFAVMNLDLQSGFRAFGEWLFNYEMTTAYEEYRQQLQIMLQRHPTDQLVLKCPEHLWFVDSLLKVFPDACIVWTHRDPLPAIASYCSLISMSWRMLYGKFDPEVIGQHVTDRFHVGVTRAMAARKQADPSRFYDVSFPDLVKDPAAVVRQIKSHFDLPHDPETDVLMENYLQKKRLDQRGAHKYSISRYGLDPAAIDAQYGEYIEQCKVQTRFRNGGQ